LPQEAQKAQEANNRLQLPAMLPCITLGFLHLFAAIFFSSSISRYFAVAIVLTVLDNALA
jgi:hypothetical protein